MFYFLAFLLNSVFWYLIYFNFLLSICFLFLFTSWMMLNAFFLSFNVHLQLILFIFVCLFVVYRPTREFFTQMDTSPFPVILTYAQHFWKLSSEGSLTCHIHCDTGLPFIMVISEDPWHSHLLPSVWQWSCHTLFLRLRSVATGDRTQLSRMRGERTTSTPPWLWNWFWNEDDMNMVLTLRLNSLMIWNIFAEFVKFGRKESCSFSLLNTDHTHCTLCIFVAITNALGVYVTYCHLRILFTLCEWSKMYVSYIYSIHVMAEILTIRRKTLSYQSINQSINQSIDKRKLCFRKYPNSSFQYCKYSCFKVCCMMWFQI